MKVKRFFEKDSFEGDFFSVIKKVVLKLLVLIELLLKGQVILKEYKGSL